MPAIEIKGLEQLFRKLERAKAIETLRPPMQRGVLRLQRAMQEYPPAPAHSTYKRTGTYGKRWLTKVDTYADGLVGRVGNNVAYAPFVGSSIFQTRQHASTGWETDQKAVDENEAAILADFQQAIDRALAG